jgi:hypothetical protein
MIQDDEDGGSTQNLAPMPKQNSWSVLWWRRSTSSGANAHVLEPRAASASVSCTLLVDEGNPSPFFMVVARQDSRALKMQITDETPVDLLAGLTFLAKG